jgi:type 1 glutamine amidotransferase
MREPPLYPQDPMYPPEPVYRRDPYSRERLRVLLSFDMSKLPDDKAGREDKDNPIAWIQQVEKGRGFYCSLGHAGRVFRDPTIMRFYIAGIQ